jgi:hypothetical protein
LDREYAKRLELLEDLRVESAFERHGDWRKRHGDWRK